MKGFYGDKTWKLLRENSFSRNKLIATGSMGAVSKVQSLSKVPSTLLKKKGDVYTDQTGLWVVDALKQNKALSKRAINFKDHNYNMYGLRNLYSDTKNMARKVEKPFNGGWSFKKMHKKHEDYTRRVQAIEESPDYLLTLDCISVKYKTDGAYEATLLDSRYKIKEQGRKERHCVGGYTNSVAEGKYLVYSIIHKESGKESTLGVNISGKGKTKRFSYSQHYYAMNKYVSHQDLMDFAEDLVLELNEKDGGEDYEKTFSVLNGTGIRVAYNAGGLFGQ